MRLDHERNCRPGVFLLVYLAAMLVAAGGQAIAMDNLVAADHALQEMVKSGATKVDALLPLLGKGNDTASNQRLLFAQALGRLAPARDDLASIKAAQVDILRSLLTALASEIRREDVEKIENGLPDVQAAIWKTYVVPMRRDADKFGLVPLAQVEGKVIGRWYDRPAPREVSVFELFADEEQKTLSWTITDIRDRRAGPADELIRAETQSAKGVRGSKLVVYLETSGLGEDIGPIIKSLAKEEPTQLKVIVEDVGSAVDLCVARAKAPPMPVARPGTEDMRGTLNDVPAEAGTDASAAKPSPKDPPEQVPAAPPASPVADDAPGKVADAARKAPAFDETAARQSCEASYRSSFTSARDVAVIVDPRRQIGVWSSSLMLPADVERAAKLAASLVKDWP